MPRLPPHPEPFTRHDVARALEWAWTYKRRGQPLTPNAAAVMAMPAIYLAGHPHELACVYDHAKAMMSGLSVRQWLKEMGRAQSTHARNWRTACERIAEAHNETDKRGRFAIDSEKIAIGGM